MSKDNLGGNLVFFLLGAATGAAIALLYAPQEGEATRRYLGEKAAEVKDKASEHASNLSQQAKDTYSNVAGQAKDTYTNVAGQAKDTYSNVAQQAKDHVDRISTKAQEIFKSGQQAANDSIDNAADKSAFRSKQRVVTWPPQRLHDTHTLTDRRCSVRVIFVFGP